MGVIVSMLGAVTPLFMPTASTYFLPGWRDTFTFNLRFTEYPVILLAREEGGKIGFGAQRVSSLVYT